MALEYRILGPFEVLRDGEKLSLERRRERALLVLLVLSANRVVSADLLAEDVWGGAPPRTALSALRVHISRLRQALGRDGSALCTRPGGYLLRVQDEAVDAVRFEGLCAEGRQLAAAGEHAEATKVLGKALALWRGPALAEVSDAPSARAEAVRLEEARLAAMEDRIEAELASGDHRLVAGELEALTRANPLRERLWMLRMLALHRSGRRAEALRAYQDLRHFLGQELGLEPGEAVRQLEAAIVRHDPSLGPGPSADAVGIARLPAPAVPPRLRAFERKQVTVLFAGVADSTHVAAQLDLEDWGDLVRRFFSILRETVTRFGGTVDQFTGDGIMALFGAPVAHEDHGRRACAAALRIRAEVARYGEELERERGITFGVRIGLHSGEVVAGPLSDDERVGTRRWGTPLASLNN